MITLTTDYAKALLDECLDDYSSVDSTCLDVSKLRGILNNGRILSCTRWETESSLDELLDEVGASIDVNAIEPNKAIYILQYAPPASMSDMIRYQETARKRIPDIFDTITGYIWDDTHPYFCITGIVYQENSTKPNPGGIVRDYRRLKKIEEREHKSLGKDIARIDEQNPVIAISKTDIDNIMEEHHLLWHGEASSIVSSKAIVAKLTPGIMAQKKEYDVSGMFVFLDIDNDFSTMSDINTIREGLTAIVGNDVTIGLTVLVKHTSVKSISCRVYLFGNPLYVMGELFYDYGCYSIILYKSDYEKRGNCVTASFSDGKLTISRMDWGDFDRNKEGITYDYYDLDAQATAKLLEVMKAKRPETLLLRLKSRFAKTHHAFAVEDHIVHFLKAHDIQYDHHFYD